jgi:hypothetical protein
VQRYPSFLHHLTPLRNFYHYYLTIHVQSLPHNLPLQPLQQPHRRLLARVPQALRQKQLSPQTSLAWRKDLDHLSKVL